VTETGFVLEVTKWPQPRMAFKTVRKGAAWLPCGYHDGWMANKRHKKRADNATQASVEKEMAKPRMARSARVAELKLDITRIPDPPSTTMPGIVDKIIPSRRASQPEKAQIAVKRADPGHRNLRIENSLTDEHGDDVKLKRGAHVEVTVTTEP
jgi:hypothetical protein